MIKTLSLVLLTFSFNTAFADTAPASTWYCKGPADTNISILLKGQRALYVNAHEEVSPVMTVDEKDKNIFYHSEGGDCSNQIIGYMEVAFEFLGAKSKLSYSWCDDDGDGGEGEYDLTCSVIE